MGQKYACRDHSFILGNHILRSVNLSSNSFDKPISISSYRLASEGAVSLEQGQLFIAPWCATLTLTALAASMAVNSLVTGLIVFNILEVFLEVKPTSVAERKLGSLSSTRGTKLRHIIFVIIESGMALFAIQLVRVVITSLVEFQALQMVLTGVISFDLVIGIHEILNVIIKICSFLLLLFY